MSADHFRLALVGSKSRSSRSDPAGGAGGGAATDARVEVLERPTDRDVPLLTARSRGVNSHCGISLS